jgi:hypothetical protein
MNENRIYISESSLLMTTARDRAGVELSKYVQIGRDAMTLVAQEAMAGAKMHYEGDTFVITRPGGWLATETLEIREVTTEDLDHYEIKRAMKVLEVWDASMEPDNPMFLGALSAAFRVMEGEMSWNDGLESLSDLMWS